MRGDLWSAEGDARLRELWADTGLSTAEIGRRMGMTKNAVVGRAHRLHLPARPSPIRREGPAKPRQPKPKVQRVERVAHVVVRAVQPVKLAAPVVVASVEPPRPRVVKPARAGCCRWIGEVAEGFSCSAPVARGSYYAEHAARVYRPREDAAA